MIKICDATQNQLDQLELLINGAKLLSDCGNTAFGPLQQQDFFAAVAKLFREPEQMLEPVFAAEPVLEIALPPLEAELPPFPP